MKNVIRSVALCAGLVASAGAQAEFTFYVLGGAGYANIDSDIKVAGSAVANNEQSLAAYTFGGGFMLDKAVGFEFNRVAFGDTSDGVEYTGYNVGIYLNAPFNEYLSLVSRADYYRMDYEFASGGKGDGHGIGVGLGLRYVIPTTKAFVQGTYKYIRYEADVDGTVNADLNTIIHYPVVEAGYQF